jgi:glycosyltransferase involved in cell wall biosynthesis
LPYIFFHGYEEDVNKIYQDKHVYVFPTYFEGSSKTVFEAMAFGLPVITTFNSGSQVKDGLNGYIIEMNCPSDIFLTMKKFMDEPELVLKMGEESLSIAKTYSWEDYAKKINLCYEQLK